MGVALLFIAALIGWYWWAKNERRRSAEEDNIKFSKICDTTRVITEKPSFMMGKFHKSEIDRLRFYIIRNNKIVKDTTVNYEITSEDHYLHEEIPFDKFLKTDTIIVETKDSAKRYYRLSGFHHYANLHYGMFGYAGGHDCRLSETYTINGKESEGIMLKPDGIKQNILPK